MGENCGNCQIMSTKLSNLQRWAICVPLKAVNNCEGNMTIRLTYETLRGWYTGPSSGGR